MNHRTASRRLLAAFHRFMQSGYSLSATRFLVLCDCHDLAGQAVSYRRRAARLGIGPSTMLLAYQALHAAKLIEIDFGPQKAKRIRRDYTAIRVTPTPEAVALLTRHQAATVRSHLKPPRS